MTTDVLTLIFLVLHIVAAGIWVSQFVADYALARVAEAVRGKPGELAIQMAEGRLGSLLGTVGGMGILVTGLLLTLEFHYGILGIGGVYTPTWLVIKQLVYVVALLLAMLVLQPGARRAMPMVGQAAASGQPLSAEAQATLSRMQLASRVVNLLVLINIFVGVFGVNGAYLSGR